MPGVCSESGVQTLGMLQFMATPPSDSCFGPTPARSPLPSDPGYAGLGARTGAPGAPGGKRLLSRSPSDPRQSRTQTGLAETTPNPQPAPQHSPMGHATSSGSPRGVSWRGESVARLTYYLNALDHQPVPGPLSAVNSAALVQHRKSLMPTVPTVTTRWPPGR